jgi:uncharacterized protein (DUF58 family)
VPAVLSGALDLTLDELIRAGLGGPAAGRTAAIDHRLAGGRRVRRRGVGLDLDTIGTYQQGDDIRHIDWQATARTGRAQVRRFHREVQWPLIILLDLRRSMFFGSASQLMAKTACLAAAALAWTSPARGEETALSSQQPLGLILLGDGPPEILPPRRGRRPRLRLLNRILGSYHARLPATFGRETALDQALQGLDAAIRRDAEAVLISNFSLPGDGFAAAVQDLALKRGRLGGLLVEDRMLQAPPPGGLYPLRTAGSLEVRPIAFGRRNENIYREEMAAERSALRRRLDEAGIAELGTVAPETFALGHG